MSDFYGVNPKQLPSDERLMKVEARPAVDTTKSSAALGADAMHAMFGLDRSMVYETLLNDYCTLPTPATSDLPVVGINLVNNGEQGITPGQLVAGYNKVAGRKDSSAIHLSQEMFANRNASWWNRRTPNGQSRMTTALLFGAYIIGAAHYPEDGNKTWSEQQKDLSISCGIGMPNAAYEGITPGDFIVADAMRLISSIDRPRLGRRDTLVRFVQHEMELNDRYINYGPYGVNARTLSLYGDIDGAIRGIGYYRLMAPLVKY